jgi:FtsZ-interacting cell division protein ZipA
MSFTKHEHKNDFELFIADLQAIAEDLGVVLLDEDRNRVSQQTLNYTREHII